MRLRPALLLAVLPGLATAQRLRPVARGAASITIADVQRRIGIIADDSMLGRATPSPQLDAVAAYVAGEFHRFGLKPGGDSGTYFQHYPLEVLRFDPESSTIRITGRTPGMWRGGQDVLLVEGQAPAGAAAGPAVVITGSADGRSTLDSAAVPGQIGFLGYGATDPSRLVPWPTSRSNWMCASECSSTRRLPTRSASSRAVTSR